MVAGLSMGGRSCEHAPLPPMDEEASSLRIDAGVNLQSEAAAAAMATTGGERGDEESLLGPRGTPAGPMPDDNVATKVAHSTLASSEAELPCSTVCALLDSGGEKVEEAERARVRRKLSWAIVLCSLFMGIEVCGGLVSNSLAILTDAAHLLSDVAGFTISLFALWAVSWRATQRHSYGYQRMEVLGALASILMTWAITAVIVLEAFNRLVYSREEVNGQVMFVTAAFGVVVNVAMAVLLFEHHSHGLPGQACSGHAHSHEHAHTLNAPPSPKKVQGYGRLEQAEQGPAEKDAFVEAGKVELAKTSSPAHVAVVVHQAEDGHEEESAHSALGGHAHHGQHHPPHPQQDGHPHTPHGHAHAQSHAHHGHAHSCKHGVDLRRDSPSHTSTPVVAHEEKGAAVTALFGPLQLLSDAPSLLPAHEGHIHRDGQCGSGHAHGPQKQNINLRGAFVHVVGDLVQSVGVMVAGAIIWIKPQWRAVDLGCTFLFSALVVATTVKIFRDIVEILMECTPREVDAAGVEAGLLAVEGVQAVHELHIWAVSVGKNVLACHVEAKQGADAKRVLQEASTLCNEKYRIKHVTLQIEQ